MIVFGGTGFLSKHLLKRLGKSGSEGIVVGRDPDMGFLAQHSPGFIPVQVADFWERAEAILKNSHAIVYLASASIPATFVDEPWKELSANVEPLFHLICRCMEINPKVRLIYTSSGGTVYGGGFKSPIPETAPLSPISPYGFGKLASEEAISFLGRTRGLDYAVLRISNPIGQFQRRLDQGIVGAAFRAAATSSKMRLFDRGTQVRDFIDADEVAEAIELATLKREFSQVTWNIGSGEGLTIREIVSHVEEFAGRSIDLEFLPARPGDLKYSVLDCAKVHRDIGWKSRTDTVTNAIRKVASSSAR